MRVVNVKPAAKLAKPRTAEALAWPGQLIEGHGWQYEIWSGADPVLLANLRFLAGYRALDVIGAGNELRALAIPQELGIRRSGGRWLIRSATGQNGPGPVRGPGHPGAPGGRDRRAGGPRSGGVLSLGAEVTAVEPGGNAAARVSTTVGELEADLVVAADGIGSATRPALFPGHPGLRYAGFTTWRLLTGPVSGEAPMAESWGAAPSSASCRCPTGASTATPPRRQTLASAPGTSWTRWSGSSASSSSARRRRPSHDAEPRPGSVPGTRPAT
jgi:hypothetical protein